MTKEEIVNMCKEQNIVIGNITISNTSKLLDDFKKNNSQYIEGYVLSLYVDTTPYSNELIYRIQAKRLH